MSSRTSPPPSGLRRPSSTFRTSVLGNHIAAPPPPPEVESERQSPDTASSQTSRRRPPPSERKTSRHSIRIDTRDTARADVTPRNENPPRRPPSMQSGLEPATDKARPTSVASSEFDAYYFSVPSPNQSRRASLVPEDSYAQQESAHISAQEHQATVKARNRLSLNRTSLLIPETPVRDPGAIDRRALVGVGELTTPRWTVTRDSRAINHGQHDFGAYRSDDRHSQPRTPGEEVPHSPWTIEAIDASDSGDGRLLSTKFPRAHAMSSRNSVASSVSAGAHPSEGSSQSAQLESPNPSYRSIKPKMSMTEESGGEEILYKPPPRKTAGRPSVSSGSSKRLSGAYVQYRDGTGSSIDISPIDISAQSSPATGSAILPPPSAYNQQVFPKARKRTSDEFDMDQSGALISKTTGSSLVSAGARNGVTERDKERDDKVVRRHRSLGVGVPANPPERLSGKERRRGDSVALNMSTSTSTSTNTSTSKSPPVSTTPRAAGEKHIRQTSASSTSSFHDITHPRRHDFSHLPPSPSTSSIQHFMKHGANAPAPGTPPLPSHHSSPSVAHSLLRGTQEGWAALEDSSTAEALRKLDGLSGKNVRARSSVGSGSRPTTPGQKTGRLSRPGSKEQLNSMTQETDPSAEPLETKPAGKKPSSRDGPPGPRASFGPPTPKRSSIGSTTFTGTPTTGSRDSASLSTATSATSTSLFSRKLRRNSGGSDASSGYAAAEAGGLVEGEGAMAEIPPVPPLPKDLSAYKTPPMSSGITFPGSGSNSGVNGGENGFESASDALSSIGSDDPDKTVVFPSMTITSPTSPPVPARQPTKKWSFSNALNLRLPSGSPKEPPQTPQKELPNVPHKDVHAPQTPHKDAHEYVASPQKTPRSQGSISFSAGHAESGGGGSYENWSAVEHSEVADFSPSSAPGMSAFSRTPESGGYHYPRTPEAAAHNYSKTPETAVQSFPRTPERPLHARTPDAHSVSSASTLDTGAPQAVSSPSAKLPRRLTPSSIPFFRRSSSQSIQVQQGAGTHHQREREGSVSPTFPPPPSLTHQASSHSVSSMASESGFSQSGFSGISGPPSASKKSSVLNLGSLLKGSSSRKSVSGDKSDTGKSGEEKERRKKEDKERSESRISALMGRKRGKTISSAENKRGSKPVTLPPMQMSVLPPTTVQRVANLKSSSTSTPTRSTISSANRTSASPASTMSKASDNSLRSSRQHLPTIAGSPSVGMVGQQTREAREAREGMSALSNATVTKDTPTKIPRSRRTSLNLTGLSVAQQVQVQSQSGEYSPSAHSSSTNEFGMVTSGDTPKPQYATTNATQRTSVRASPQSVSRVPRQSNVGGSSSSSSATPSVTKKSTNPVSLSNLRKFSNNSTSFLSPKVTLPVTRVVESSSRGVTPATPSSSRQSLSTPSPVPMEVDEEELAGDEEMMAYIRRLHARKLASGAKREELDEMLKFPEPIPPKTGMTPTEVLESSQNDHLCEYERKEMMDFPRVYCVGAGSKKNMGTLSNSTNNFGYDDERGDYLVIKHDHLAYRYEIIDTLGKGSFGQVLHCRDHCTGMSVGIKIIRNKKRFHHQALVEIKILDNLRKWDPEEKNHVLKMNEHFTFRNHLCIVTELLSINLYELIKANGFAGFTTALIRRFTSQMLSSLVLMRQHRIVHCDLKPENVLLLHPAKSALKVIDFGSSCFEHEKVYTYIQSRFYRSPEVILGMNYHMAIDMWSLGCILAELYTGFPIFPGENEQEQLSCIMEVLGVPDKDLINRSSRKRLFFETNGQPRPVVNSKGRRRRPGTKTLAQVLRCDDELFVDFIAKCLIWDPERRLKPQPAMRHPFIAAGRRPKITSPAPTTSTRHLFTPSSSSSAISSSRTKPLATPQKSQIGAPTPLSSRIATRAPTTTTASVPQTPVSHSHTNNLSTPSAHRYRVPASTSAYSSRTLPPASNGYAQ